MSCRKTNYGVNDYNPGIISVLKVRECVMGEARSTQGRDKTEFRAVIMKRTNPLLISQLLHCSFVENILLMY